ncbi:hypothetical protein BJX70DRAFT_384954 [Aspergillus crustosus]
MSSMSIMSIMSSGSSGSSKSNKTQGGNTTRDGPHIITRFSLPNEPTPHQLRSLPAGSLLALRSYLEGLKDSYISNLNNHRASIPSTIRRQAGSTLRLVVQILAIYKLNSCVNKYHNILSSSFLEPFDKICHAITYAADSFNKRGYRVCNKHGNKVNMSA